MPLFDRERDAWTHPTDYSRCQDLADAARSADVDVLRYASARAPAARSAANVALLRCRAFAAPAPLERQTWRIDMGATGVRALCTFPDQRLEFTRDAFARDPRIAGMRWERRQGS